MTPAFALDLLLVRFPMLALSWDAKETPIFLTVHTGDGRPRVFAGKDAEEALSRAEAATRGAKGDGNG
jgi:hypothetical protein